MGLFKRRNADPHAAAETEVAHLRVRCGELSALLRDAEDAADLAARRRSEALTGEEDLAASLPDLDRQCAEAEHRKAARADAYSELQLRLAEAERALAADRDKGERKLAAADLERRAEALDAATASLTKALSEAAAAHRDLTAAVARHGIRTAGGFVGYEPTAETIATTVLAAALNEAFPGLQVSVAYRHADSPAVRPAAAVAREVLTDRMRALAPAVRAGESPIEAAAPIGTAPRQINVVVPDTAIALAECVEWNGVNGHPVQAIPGGVTIPVPCAEAAIAQGIGFPINSAEGTAILREAAGPDIAPGAHDQRARRVRRGPPYKHLGVNLHAYVEAERQRLLNEAAA